MTPRKQAGHMTCTRPQAARQISLATGASSTHDPQQTLARRLFPQRLSNGASAVAKTLRHWAECAVLQGNDSDWRADCYQLDRQGVWRRLLARKCQHGSW